MIYSPQVVQHALGDRGGGIGGQVAATTLAGPQLVEDTLGMIERGL